MDKKTKDGKNQTKINVNGYITTSCIQFTENFQTGAKKIKLNS